MCFVVFTKNPITISCVDPEQIKFVDTVCNNLGASRKPSTWLPPGRLVEHNQYPSGTEPNHETQKNLSKPKEPTTWQAMMTKLNKTNPTNNAPTNPRTNPSQRHQLSSGISKLNLPRDNVPMTHKHWGTDDRAQNKRNVPRAPEPTTYNPEVKKRNASLNTNVPSKQESLWQDPQMTLR